MPDKNGECSKFKKRNERGCEKESVEAEMGCKIVKEQPFAAQNKC